MMTKDKVSKKVTKRSQERKYPYAPSDAVVEKAARDLGRVTEEVRNSTVGRKLKQTRD